MLFVGNALLDISIECDVSLLSQYKLTEDESSLFEEWQLPLLDHVFNDKKALTTAGGSSQNSARIASALLSKRFNSPMKVYFMGCIGNDNFGNILKQKVEESGITTLYDVIDSKSTGVAVGLITSNHRTLIANLGAANTFNEKFIFTSQVQSAVENCSLIHIEGFFVCHSPSVSLKFVECCHSKRKIVSLGLSAKYVVEDHFDDVLALLPFCDVIFGNDGEAKSFAQKLNKSCNTNNELELVVKSILQINKNGTFSLSGNEVKRAVFVTSGPNAVTVGVINVDNTIVITTHPVPKVEVKGDTIGAGDAFLGAAVAALSQQKSLDFSINFAIEIAAQCCNYRGCSIAECFQ
ncbi:adenosine kinase 1-like isoform X1 [Leptotrombidium deliense]|uniref:Adenosine kinase n=1 Tax=Leptotrombidium deliense TaxID=299467 RepID=A0A443S7F1_9ACAR|nr:adenosine kinase 1-like isoform X1 [Leptotrombidium deliense]